MTFVLEFDGAFIRSEDAFHQSVKEQTGIDWYGCNLGAFDEMLSFMIAMEKGPFRIVWKNADLANDDRQFPLYDTLVCMMKEAEQRFPDRIIDFTMTFAEPYWGDDQDPFPRK